MANAQITNAGLNLLAAGLQGSQNPAILYVALGTGAGSLRAGITSGTPITSLPVNALPAALSSGQQLTIIYQTNTDVVTLSAAAAQGATSISINSWTPAYSFPAGSALVNTPSANDLQLQAETLRKPVGSAISGANPGESLLTVYVAPTDSPGVTFCEVGWFGGSTASSSPNTGTLVARGVGWWAHTSGDSGNIQLDTTV
jgi:hypothetical protein